MMHLRYVWLIGLLVSTLFGTLLFGMASPVYAQSNSFTARVVPNERQVAPFGYFHIPATPGERLNVNAQLINHMNEPIQLRSTAMNAYTSEQGIYYQTQTDARNRACPILNPTYEMTRYLQAEAVYTLAPHERRVVSFQVQLPKNLQGTLLGAIRFVTTEADRSISTESSGQSMIIQRYQAVDLAIQIDTKGSLPSPQVVPLSKVQFQSSTPSLLVQFEHRHASIRSQDPVRYEVRDRHQRVLYSGNIALPTTAPWTCYVTTIPWLNQTLAGGSYSIHLFQAEKDVNAATQIVPFQISDEHIEQVQIPRSPSFDGSTTSIVTKKYIPLWVWMILLLLSAQTMYLFWLLKRKKS